MILRLPLKRSFYQSEWRLVEPSPELYIVDCIGEVPLNCLVETNVWIKMSAVVYSLVSKTSIRSESFA